MEMRRANPLVHLLASALVMQALLSGVSLVVGLIMIRRATDLQYGYYVLILNGFMLVVGLQAAYIQPNLVVRITRASAAERADLIGGLYRDQRRLWPLISCLVAIPTLVLWLGGVIKTSPALVTIAASITVSFVLFREFFRMVLLNSRKPVEVLVSDVVYAALLVGGVLFATTTQVPAAIATLTMGVAAVVGGLLCSRALWRFEAWNVRGAPGILRAIAPVGTWSAGGAAVHWLFSQGYSYLVAGMLNVPAVAAIAATRLTVMPINLLSTGLGTVMLPTTAAWLHAHGASRVFRRMLLIAAALGVVAACYCTFAWVVRDWLFVHVLRKQFPQRDELLLMWFAIALAMLLRDQLIYLLAVRERLRSTSTLTFFSALVSIAVSYFGILYFGVIGALAGILVGEILNVSGLVFLSVVESRRPHGSGATIGPGAARQ